MLLVKLVEQVLSELVLNVVLELVALPPVKKVIPHRPVVLPRSEKTN